MQSIGPISVSQLTCLIKSIIETGFPRVEVIGEISSLSVSSGHCYMTLKDRQAQLSAILWKSAAAKLKFDLRNGLEVIAKGRVELYAPYGKYQLIISEIVPKGIGALELAFRQLHEKLSAEGLFLASSKKRIPSVLRRIGLITSPTGAAIRDFLNILGRRTRRTDVVVLPVKVQGEGASREIVNAFRQIERGKNHLGLDAVVLIRGGGSTEDLWTFNEEPTVRAVAACRLPVITGIGHEIDVSLCDLAADLHALTPSDAAARIVPDDTDLKRKVADLEYRLHREMDRRYRYLEQRWETASRAVVFQSPEVRIIGDRLERVKRLENALNRQMDTRIDRSEFEIARMARLLESISPLNVLSRGYSVTQTAAGEIVRSSDQVQPGDTILTRLEHGNIASTVQNRDF